MDKSIIYLTAIITTIFLCACEENGEISITDDSTFDFFYIDTLTLDISTVHVDSIITELAPSLIIGTYEDPVLGTINANSFFQLTLESAPSFDSEDTFDSLGIIIYPYRNTYGVGQSQNVSVFRITESFEPKEDFFFQFDALALDQEPLASFTLESTEEESDSVFIRLPDALGQEIFQMAIDGDEALQTDTEFQEFFHGLAFQTTNNGNFVSTIPFDSTGVKMQIYYRRPTEDDVQESTYTFPASANANRFNQVLNENTDDLLHEIIDAQEISTTKTSDIGFIQGASSLATKIQVPHIDKINTAFDLFAINYATLEVIIFSNSSDETPFPQQLSLHYLSKFENLDQAISSPIEGRTITGNLVYDEELGQFAKYEFNVGVYVENLLNTQGLDDESFYLTIPSNQIGSNINTVAIDATTLSTKLNIYISKYND